MTDHSQPTLSTKALYESAVLRVQDYQCTARRSGPATEHECVENTIVLLRSGNFCQHFGRRRVTATVNQVVFFTKLSEYQISHPDDLGNRGTLLTISPAVLSALVCELDPSAAERPDRPFPFVIGPCDTPLYLRYLALIAQLQGAGNAPPDALWVETTSLNLASALLTLAYRRHDKAPVHKATTAHVHRERIEAVKAFLAVNLSQRLTLADIASAVAVSPFHLARSFRHQAHVPIHRYLSHLRFREAFDRLRDGDDNVSTLAHELGFSSHSHFSDGFRREFGFAPSDAQMLRRKRGCVASRNRTLSPHLRQSGG